MWGEALARLVYPLVPRKVPRGRLRRRSTTPGIDHYSIGMPSGDRVPENPLESLERGDRQVSFMIGVAYVKSSTTPGIEHYSPSATKIEAGPGPKNRTA